MLCTNAYALMLMPSSYALMHSSYALMHSSYALIPSSYALMPNSNAYVLNLLTRIKIVNIASINPTLTITLTRF